MLAFVVSELGEILDNVAMSFLLLFLTSEVIGSILASLAVDRIPWAYNVHVVFVLISCRAMLGD